MTITLHYNGEYQDSIIFCASGIEEARETAQLECKKRGWDIKDCRSEVEQ